jgi:YrbI family 3-deoxy-D-manno-octulosonate 8-phosphate phosphatase
LRPKKIITVLEYSEKAKKIKLLLTDCDGVLTDGGVYYGENGEVLKRFNIRDGMGVERLRNICGIETGIITGEVSPSVAKRAEKLKLKHLYLGIKDKSAELDKILEATGLKEDEIAYIGDDVNDLPAIKRAGFTACPADALPQVLNEVDYICVLHGGQGAFREFAEKIILSYEL